MKKKLLFAVAMMLAAVGAKAQTDVTSTYLTNADFEGSTALTSDYLYGYSNDGSPSGFQDVEGWSYEILRYDGNERSGMGGGVFAYGSDTALKGNNKKAPAEAFTAGENNALAFFGVWGCGGYYYQEVELSPGGYELTIPVYNASGTQNNTSYIGFIPNEGTSSTVACNPTVGQWTTLTVKFTLTEKTAGRIALGYKSTGSGSGSNPHLFFESVTIKWTDPLKALKADYQEALAAAKTALEDPEYSNVSGTERSDLETIISVVPEETETGYSSIIESLTDATATFIAAKSAYDEYETEYAYATETLGLNIAQVYPANAAEALAATQALKVQEFEDIAAQYTEDVSSILSFSSSFGSQNNQHWNDITTQYYDSWSGSATSKTLTITSTALPAGDYILKVAGRSAPTASLAMTDGTTTVDFFANGDIGLGIDTSGATNFSTEGSYANSNNGRGWQWRYLPITLSEEGDISVTVTATLAGNSWASVAKEIYLLAVPNAEISKAALKAAIDKANEVDTKFNVGEGVFQKSESAASDFASILGAAQETYDDPKATVDVVEATTEAVLAAIDDFANAPLNAPEADNLYAITIVTDGHSHFGNAIVAGNGATSANNPTGYVFNVRGETPYLAQAFTFTSAEDAENPNDYYISIELPEGTVYLTNGTNNGSAAGWAPSQIQGTTDSSAKMAFRIAASPTVEGAFNIYNPATGYKVIAQDGGNIYTDEGAQQNGEFTLADPTVTEVATAIAAGKFATRIYPFVPQPISGVTFYTCAAANEKELVLEEATELEANTPYILYAESDVDVVEKGHSVAGEATYTDGWLTGTFAAVDIPVGSYVLQTLDGTQAFYIVEAGETTYKATPFRAYLSIPEEEEQGEVKAYTLGGIATAINTLEALTSGNIEGIYNAAGTKLNRMEKGVNIIRMNDGSSRKVMIK